MASLMAWLNEPLNEQIPGGVPGIPAREETRLHLYAMLIAKNHGRTQAASCGVLVLGGPYGCTGLQAEEAAFLNSTTDVIGGWLMGTDDAEKVVLRAALEAEWRRVEGLAQDSAKVPDRASKLLNDAVAATCSFTDPALLEMWKSHMLSSPHVYAHAELAESVSVLTPVDTSDPSRHETLVYPEGTKVLCTMVSRFGDVGIRLTDVFTKRLGYDARVSPEMLRSIVVFA